MAKPGTGIAHMMRALVSFGVPFASYHAGMPVTPVLAGYKITHRCNLKCVHCPYWKRSGEEQDFDGVIATLKALKRMGVRILILEGGEPLLWRDGNKTIADVVDQARKLFAAVCVTTNGALPWGDLPFDRVWVSLDGPPDVHDRIRGKGAFDRAWTNMALCGRGRVFVSATINTLNANAIPKLVSMLPGVAEGVTIQFHYPYGGLPDPLFLPFEDRIGLLDRLIALKTRGQPVANSFASLQEMKKPSWTCEDRLLANAEPDGNIMHGCYLKNRGEAVCELCGFAAHNEMSLAFRGRLESIATGLRVFFSSAAFTSKGIP